MAHAFLLFTTKKDCYHCTAREKHLMGGAQPLQGNEQTCMMQLWFDVRAFCKAEGPGILSLSSFQQPEGKRTISSLCLLIARA